MLNTPQDAALLAEFLKLWDRVSLNVQVWFLENIAREPELAEQRREKPRD